MNGYVRTGNMGSLRRIGLIGMAALACLMWAARLASGDAQPPAPMPAFPNPRALVGISCPSRASCTAIDHDRALSFRPGAPWQPSVVRIAVRPGDGLAAIACPSTRQCTVLTARGAEATFRTPSRRPARAGRPLRPIGMFAGPTIAASISCPAVEICTAIGGMREVTFNPRAPAERISAGLGIDVSSAGVVACPSSGRCVAVGRWRGGGAAVIFGPGASRPGLRVALPFAASGLACPAADQCTVTGATERLTFRPAMAGRGLPASAPLVAGPDSPLLSGALACPTTRLCVAAQSGPRLLRFDPRGATGASTAMGGAGAVTGLACPSAPACVATDGAPRPVVARP